MEASGGLLVPTGLPEPKMPCSASIQLGCFHQKPPSAPPVEAGRIGGGSGLRYESTGRQLPLGSSECQGQPTCDSTAILSQLCGFEWDTACGHLSACYSVK